MKKKKYYLVGIAVILVILAGMFIFNNQDNNDYMKIETPYCDLYYPNQWEDSVRININESDICMVEFYAKIGDKPEVQMFNIVFGGQFSNPIGQLDVNNESIDVSIMTFDLIDSNDWSEEEKDSYYAMQEDVNCIISNLSKLKNYSEY